MSDHISHQPVTRFLQAALECSIYAAPTDPGLTHEELVEAGGQAKFLPGEINDAISNVTKQTFGGRTKRLLPESSRLSLLMLFTPPQEPEYRNPEAFEFVFEQLRQNARLHGIKNAKVELSAMMDAAAAEQLKVNDVEVAISIMTLNQILIDENHIIKFAPGKEGYGSPAQQLANSQRSSTIQKEILARAYPIVKDIVGHRTSKSNLQPINIVTETTPGPDFSSHPEVLSQDEWISASAALAALGKQAFGARTICKRAHAGLVKARAERFIVGQQARNGIEIPNEFWWAEGEAALEQNWATGDFETWIEKRIRLRAFGVTFKRSDIELLRPVPPAGAAAFSALNLPKKGHRMIEAGKKVFIGHGRSPAWRELKDFLQDRLRLFTEEFNNVPTAGIPTVVRLEEMLDSAAFAFLLMTAEDAQPNGLIHARLNVVHEVGLFQGRLGFRKAIVLVEDGCEGFTNIDGLGQMRFQKDKISSMFEAIRHVLEREKVVQPA